MRVLHTFFHTGVGDGVGSTFTFLLFIAYKRDLQASTCVYNLHNTYVRMYLIHLLGIMCKYYFTYIVPVRHLMDEMPIHIMSGGQSQALLII